MLRTSISLFLLSAAALAPTQSQTPQDTLQALLAEVHQLRLDLQSTTVTAQRVQILLYRVQLQQAATARSSARADEVRGKLTDAQKARARVAADLQQTEESINNPSTDPGKIPILKAQAAQEKQSLEIWQNDEQQWQVRDSDAQSQLRAEQAKLDELQDTLDRLDKALANLAKQ